MSSTLASAADSAKSALNIVTDSLNSAIQTDAQADPLDPITGSSNKADRVKSPTEEKLDTFFEKTGPRRRTSWTREFSRVSRCRTRGEMDETEEDDRCIGKASLPASFCIPSSQSLARKLTQIFCSYHLQTTRSLPPSRPRGKLSSELSSR